MAQHTLHRRGLPPVRQSVTHKFTVGGFKGYLTVGVYDDGQPGEVFITMSKEGSTVSGLMDTIATLMSLALQYGVPLGVIVDQFKGANFEPSGYTTNQDIPRARSIIDYIVRWLEMWFPERADQPQTLGMPESNLTPAPAQVDALAAFDSAMKETMGLSPQAVPAEPEQLSNPDALKEEKS